MTRGRRLAYGAIFGVILIAATLVGIETMSSFYVPAWPARVMNPREPAPVRPLGEPYKNQPWLADGDNSWGMRDSERSIAKPPGTYRAAFVGDSFVESRFTPLSLSAAVQQRLPPERHIEAVNLGVGATDPRSYYYRVRDVALEIGSDAILLFLYAGNDFITEGYSWIPKLVDESPGGALVGQLMPRTNWLLVNRLDLSAFFRSRTNAPANDELMLYRAVTAPPAERLGRVVSYVKTYHYPNVPEEKLAEILSRGDNRFIDIAYPHADGEQEYMHDWMFGTLMSWEASNLDVPRDRADAPRLAGRRHVEATLSWLEATNRVAKSRGVPLVVFLVPTGSVDPAYAEFWKPWPRAYSWNWLCDEWHAQLAAALPGAGIRFVDLRTTLDGIPGTYRKMDGHWTQKGEGLVADRVKTELERLTSERNVAKAR